MGKSEEIVQQMLGSGVFFWDSSADRKCTISENFRDKLGLKSCVFTLDDIRSLVSAKDFDAISRALAPHQTHWVSSFSVGGNTISFSFDRQSRFVDDNGLVHAAGTARIIETVRDSDSNADRDSVSVLSSSFLSERMGDMLRAFCRQVSAGLLVFVVERVGKHDVRSVALAQGPVGAGINVVPLKPGAVFSSTLLTHVCDRHGLKVIPDVIDYNLGWDDELAFFRNIGARTGMGIAIRAQQYDDAWGMLAILSANPKTWTDSDKQWLTLLAETLGVLVSQAEATAKLERQLHLTNVACRAGGVSLARFDAVADKRFYLNDFGVEVETVLRPSIYRKDLKVYQEARQRVASGLSKHERFRARLKKLDDVDYLWHEVVMQVTDVNEAGAANSVVVAVRNIEEDVKREEAERKQAEFQSLIYDNMPGVVLFYNVKGQMTYANGRAVEIFGVRRREELYEINLFETPTFSEGQKMAIRTNDVCDFSLIYDFKDHGHRVLPMTRRSDVVVFSVRISKLYSAGLLVGYMALFVDITSETLHKRRISALNGFFKEIGRFSKIGIRLYGDDGFASEQWCKNIGVENEDALDLRFLASPPSVEKNDARALEEKFEMLTKFDLNAFQIEVRVNKPDGQHWLRVHFMKDADSKRISAISVDITEEKIKNQMLKRARDKAERADVLKTQFLNNISHEIRTPLNAIVGFSDLLAQQSADPEAVNYCRIIKKNNDQLLRLIEGVMDMSQIQSGDRPLNLKNVLVDDVLKLVESEFATKASAEVSFICSHDTALVHTRAMLDENALLIILRHLVSNAFNNTAVGCIRVWFELSTGFVSFHVADTGCGIPVDMQERVFESFVKVDNFNVGTGLGLAICRSLAQQMGGEVFLESVVGRGSHFWFTVPVSVPNVSHSLDEASSRRVAVLSHDESLMVSVSAALPKCEVSRCDTLSFTPLWLEKHPRLTIIDVRACGEVADILVRNIRSRGDVYKLVAVNDPCTEISNSSLLEAGANAVVAVEDAVSFIIENS